MVQMECSSPKMPYSEKKPINSCLCACVGVGACVGGCAKGGWLGQQASLQQASLQRHLCNRNLLPPRCQHAATAKARQLEALLAAHASPPALHNGALNRRTPSSMPHTSQHLAARQHIARDGPAQRDKQQEGHKRRVGQHVSQLGHLPHHPHSLPPTQHVHMRLHANTHAVPSLPLFPNPLKPTHVPRVRVLARARARAHTHIRIRTTDPPLPHMNTERDARLPDHTRHNDTMTQCHNAGTCKRPV